MLALDDVSVSFRSRPEPVLDGCSFTLAPGEHVLLLGPSGSGKSTVLQAISGVIPHSVNAERTGTVLVGGVETLDTTVADRSRFVGVLGQDPEASVCLPRVADEVAIVLENAACPADEIAGRVVEALAVAGAGMLHDRSTAELSGGETQRVALAAAVVGRPRVLLLDEPTSMLDSAGIDAVRSAVAAAVDLHAPAVVLVEHRLDEYGADEGIDGLPSRVVVLDEHGRTVADGPTASVLLDHAAVLHDLGCWLPLEAELFAMTGVRGGLGAEENRRLLLDAGGGPCEQTTPPSTSPVLVANAVVAGRSGRAACSDVNLSVRAGEIVAVIGPNGSGKSTLLHTLAGLLPPLSGDVSGARPGLVFQNPEHQFVGRTVEAEIGSGLPAGGRSILVERQLVRHRLGHVREQSPWRLSGGEKRRLSLAAMLAHERPVLLADEPTFGLDRRDSDATAAAISDAADDGTGVVFSTHDLRLVARLADRIVVIARGEVVACGDTVQVLRDRSVLLAAGIRLPALVDHLTAVARDTAHLKAALAALSRVPVVST